MKEKHEYKPAYTEHWQDLDENNETVCSVCFKARRDHEGEKEKEQS